VKLTGRDLQQTVKGADGDELMLDADAFEIVKQLLFYSLVEFFRFLSCYYILTKC
jgi:hypothetical protein